MTTAHSSSSPPSSFVAYAVHRLVAADGFLCSGMAIVILDSSNRQVLSWQPFDGVERPHTQWLGGTVILSHCQQLPPSLSVRKQYSLQAWVENLACHVSSSVFPIYAWHIPSIEDSDLLSVPVKL